MINIEAMNAFTIFQKQIVQPFRNVFFIQTNSLKLTFQVNIETLVLKKHSCTQLPLTCNIRNSNTGKTMTKTEKDIIQFLKSFLTK